MSRRALGPLGWVLFFVSTCHAGVPAVSEAVVPFRLVNHFLIVVQVRIGDAGPYDFAVDTGANVSIIDPKLAKELQIGHGERVRLNTPTGPVKVEQSELPLVRLGHIAVKRLEVVIEPLREMHNLDGQIRGVLGENFFEFFDYLLDYREKRFVIDFDHTRADLLTGERLSLEKECAGSADAVPVTVDGADAIPRHMRLKLDSGAKTSAVFADEEVKARAQTVGMAFAATTDFGTKQVTAISSKKMRIGAKEFSSVPFLIVGERKTCFDGLVPTSLLGEVYVSHSGEFVMVQPGEL